MLQYMHMARRLIIASNRLPVSVREEHGVLSLSRSNGGLATALASLFEQHDALWVGWTGMRRHMTAKEMDSLTIPSSLLPVNLNKQEIERYYDSFANGILWPLAHGLTPTVTFTSELWKAVQTVTYRFADTIASVAKPEDYIWIHDYHLLLLPRMLRDRGLKNKIGFFLHTPFPASRSAHGIPHAKELLDSLLACDLVGVQTQGDARRFRDYLVQNDMKTDQVKIKALPIGIDFDSFNAPSNDHEIATITEKYQKIAAGRKVVFSLSRLDYTKGIITQLRAYERLLLTHDYAKKVVYRLNIAPSRESMLEYQELREEIEAYVTRINQKIGTAQWQPIIYTYENIGPDEIIAWCNVAQVHLNTPVADGMNLIAKEYIASRKESGMLVISSTMGAAKQLTTALIVPPKNVIAIARALHEALAMPQKERQQRWQALRQEVEQHQAAGWADDFLHALAK
jgi:trehalose 6-phosphate synthase/phosphatase